ncbi:MAG: hypothetical protein L0I76_26250 [Pseudonocardia sp.]|nr:hypothetical protein [Pseudonocardia sp.]
MPELWDNVTVAQALLVVTAVWVLMRVIDAASYSIRRRRGLLTGDHCDHCSTVDVLDAQITHLVALQTDAYGELEHIRRAVEQTADAA